MNLKEWEKKFDQVIENQIEQYIEEKSDELYIPDPLRPKKYQLANYKNQLS